ncbi:MAG: hydrogenase accessory protein HypB [Chloroflexi bacterium CG_4_10_14_0_8_um_filter_46_9]|nr:MAG: hydrogenase accessory protein HypB [Dehalococcoidia bacterium CG2_30_46_19]PIW39926.1 MAG: hydrogenase accessory protein HypB [Chloroflexi bacterium CG15_BIG_FIL_POST_REV_8_21_14_020_46_15]PIZ27087.1 MAG: hydrogenase accessory protein HypB [Chloroflexi bacterium CG_4_10_14_0_8_um_filter_46_9]
MKKIEVLQNILEANESIAVRNQQLLDKHKVFAVNIMSAPGAGKTSLILQTIARLKNRLNIAVIEGDVASTLDAEKVKNEAMEVVQINTRNMPESCTLIAAMIEQALKDLPLEDMDLLLIENVGNLICPAEFALGEHKRIVISSLPEGDDKPTKYPLMFTNADAVIINKIDFLPYVDFDIPVFRRTVKGLNPKTRIFELSCKTSVGIEDWCNWLLQEVEAYLLQVKSA